MWLQCWNLATGCRYSPVKKTGKQQPSGQLSATSQLFVLCSHWTAFFFLKKKKESENNIGNRMNFVASPKVASSMWIRIHLCWILVVDSGLIGGSVFEYMSFTCEVSWRHQKLLIQSERRDAAWTGCPAERWSLPDRLEKTPDAADNRRCWLAAACI